MKKFVFLLICLTILGICFLNYNQITTIVMNNILGKNKLVINPGNNYEKKYNSNYVSETESYIPYSYQDLLNIIYTTINKGWSDFTFYCPNEYKECINDISTISNDDKVLTHLNNFVHPFNSFTNLKTIISDSGEITLKVNYLYSQEDIQKIDAEADKIIATQINVDDTNYDKIKILHDYIINHTKYDVIRNENGQSKYKSYIAYGPLFEGYATCNGYTDLMAILITKLNLKNYKIATTQDEISYDATGHVWNAVYVDDKWLHLDLTWDDPVSNDNKDYLYHTYFLVTTEELEKADSGDVILEEHHFDKSIYTELKEDSN